MPVKMTITAIKSNKETKRENRLRYNMTRKSRKTKRTRKTRRNRKTNRSKNIKSKKKLI